MTDRRSDFESALQPGQHGDVTEPKTPVDHALDVFIYAPLGLALEARGLLPKLIDRGRGQVSGQVTMARFVGQFAVKQGQSEAGKHLSRVQEQATIALTDLGLLPRNEPARSSAPPAAATPEPPPAPVSENRRRTRSEPGPKKRPPGANRVATDPAPSARTLAIPDYDSLAASQVISRLEGLAGDELEAVRTYESGTRGRKTILSKISQLQS